MLLITINLQLFLKSDIFAFVTRLSNPTLTGMRQMPVKSQGFDKVAGHLNRNGNRLYYALGKVNGKQRSRIAFAGLTPFFRGMSVDSAPCGRQVFSEDSRPL